MKDLSRHLQKILSTHLKQTQFDLIQVTPIPLEKVLSEQNESHQTGTMNYLVQLRPKKSAKAEIYLSNGRLNIPFLIKNANLLFEAGEFQLARNIFKSILLTGEYTSLALERMGRCFEAEGKLEQARAVYENWIQHSPCVEAYQKLAGVFLGMGKKKQAADILERVRKLNSSSFSAQVIPMVPSVSNSARSSVLLKHERDFPEPLDTQSGA